jgi:hypothetical protein
MTERKDFECFLAYRKKKIIARQRLIYKTMVVVAILYMIGIIAELVFHQPNQSLWLLLTEAVIAGSLFYYDRRLEQEVANISDLLSLINSYPDQKNWKHVLIKQVQQSRHRHDLYTALDRLITKYHEMEAL